VRGETASGRWAVVLGEGAWRWAARTGPGLNLYRGLYAGLVGWLLSPAGDEPVLLREAPRHGEAPVWRVAAGVRDLVIEVRDSTGRVVWADSAAAPADSLRGPMLEAGGAAFAARGRSERGPFQVAAPFDVTPAAELTPRAIGAPFDVRSVDTTERRIVGLRGRPPVWPFAAAVVLLCAEWLWRRRIGLR